MDLRFFEFGLAHAGQRMRHELAAPEREDGLATTLVKHDILRGLERQGLDLNRLETGVHLTDAQGRPVQARDASGQVVGAKPDISYVTARGTRVNIELDTSTSGARGHVPTNNSDPKAMNYYVLIDPNTRQITGAVVRNPSGSVVTIGPKRLQQLAQGQFPKPAAIQPGSDQPKPRKPVPSVEKVRQELLADQQRRAAAAAKPARRRTAAKPATPRRTAAPARRASAPARRRR